MTEGLLKFYREMLNAWGKLLKIIEPIPQGRESILNQPLFLNKNILKQGKVICFKKWMVAGITRVQDILYEFKKEFLSEQFFIDAMEEAKKDYDQKELGMKQEEKLFLRNQIQMSTGVNF
ncbi:MAG: hypothetical protein ACRCVL_01170 [Cetobacterium sp.]